jgi:hypothetical protein
VEYPGEIRAAELASLKVLAPTLGLRPTDAVLLAGDFNINVRGQRVRGESGVDGDRVLAGCVPHATAPSSALPPLRFDTGYVASRGGPEGRAAPAAAEASVGRFVWRRDATLKGPNSEVVLCDAFDGVNRRTADARGVLGSSHNAARVRPSSRGGACGEEWGWRL